VDKIFDVEGNFERKKIDISKYDKSIAYLKSQSRMYKLKKGKILQMKNT
jgi:hypothetical protein